MYIPNKVYQYSSTLASVVEYYHRNNMQVELECLIGEVGCELEVRVEAV